MSEMLVVRVLQSFFNDILRQRVGGSNRKIVKEVFVMHDDGDAAEARTLVVDLVILNATRPYSGFSNSRNISNSVSSLSRKK